MNVEELNALSYRDLQKFAKTKNVKARQPREALIKALLEVEKVEEGPEKVEESSRKVDETFDASMASSIMTDDAKSEIETDEEEVKTSKGTRKSAKRKGSPKETKRNPKRRRFAEFYSAPRSSSPIPSDPTPSSESIPTPNSRQSIDDVIVLTPPPRVLNATITLEPSPAADFEPKNEEEEILSSGKVPTPRSSGRKKSGNLNSTVNIEPKNPGKCGTGIGKTGNPIIRKSLLGIPLRKSLVGSPASVRKVRPSVPISAQKLVFAAQKTVQLTPSTSRKSFAAEGSVKKTADSSSKPGNN